MARDLTRTNIRLDRVYARANKTVYKHLTPLERRFIALKEKMIISGKGLEDIRKAKIYIYGANFYDVFSKAIENIKWNDLKAMRFQKDTPMILQDAYDWYWILDEFLKDCKKYDTFFDKHIITEDEEDRILRKFNGGQRKVGQSF